MCAGIALYRSEIPDELFAQQAHLSARVYHRGGLESEVRFLWDFTPRLLPVLGGGGRLKFVKWGSSDRRGRLPVTGWTWQNSVEMGKWNAFEPELVTIPASFGIDRGVWFPIREGVRGVLVRNEAGEEVVYMICEPPTRFYAVMTRGDRMPCLIDEVI